jgi:hypothetical protein
MKRKDAAAHASNAPLLKSVARLPKIKQRMGGAREPAVMSNVVMMNLLKARQAGPSWNALHLHPQDWIVASTAIFLFGWGGGVIARIPPVPAVGGRSWMRAAPTVRHRGSGHR